MFNILEELPPSIYHLHVYFTEDIVREIFYEFHTLLSMDPHTIKIDQVGMVKRLKPGLAGAELCKNS